MNKAKFNLYNVISPNSKDIPAIAKYIIDNNINDLPKQLKNSESLFLELAKEEYTYLFLVKFNHQVYQNCVSHISDTDNIIYQYIYNNGVNLSELPEEFITNPKFLNLMFNIPYKYTEILNITANDKTLYDSLDKNILAREINYGQLMNNSIHNPFVPLDEELFKIMLKQDAILYMPNIFSDTLYDKLEDDEILYYLAKGRISLGNLPNHFMTDLDFLKKILKSNQMSDNLIFKVVDQILNYNNTECTELLYELLCKDTCPIKTETYRNKLDKNGLASYIIKNHISGNVSNKITTDQKLFEILIQNNALEALYINFNHACYSQYFDEVFNLFKQNKEHKRISYNALAEISKNPRLLEPDNIKIMGDYIAKSRDKNFDGINSNLSYDALFEYLYNLDIDFLFQLRFNMRVYENFPVEKLKSYYQRHPQSLDHLSNAIILAIKGECESIEYLNIKPVILQISRKQAESVMQNYSGLGFRICESIKENGASKTYEQYKNIFKEITKYLNITSEEIMSLLENYQQKPALYEEKINNLARKFYTTKSEKTALIMTNDTLENIKKVYTSADTKAYDKKIKKQKRKKLYLAYLTDKIKNNNLDLSEAEIIKIINSLRPSDNPIEIIDNIINGKTIINAPPSYTILEKIKTYRRLRDNYESILNKIYQNNYGYRSYIIKYLKNELSHEELRKIVSSQDTIRLHETKQIMNEIGADINFDNGNIIFTGDYQLTAGENEINKQYEMFLGNLNRLQKAINKEMTSRFPLDKIEITEEDMEGLSIPDAEIKYYLDFKKAPPEKVGYLLYLLEIGEDIRDAKEKRIYQKLLVDSGLMYAIPFIIDDEYYDKFLAIWHEIDFVKNNFPEKDITFENIEKIYQKINEYKYTKASDIAILGSEVISKIVNNEEFITATTDNDKRNRVMLAAKYTALASKNVKSTIPFLSVSEAGIKAQRYKSNDPTILTSGIDTDACFRLMGNDNDFLLYTMFSKNGFVLKLTDENDSFVGRVSGFRNGNILYLNQARSIEDMHGNYTKEGSEKVARMRTCIEKYAKEIVDKTKDTPEPIEYVFILAAYGYGNCDYLEEVDRIIIPAKKPMNVDSQDYRNFQHNPDLTLKEKGQAFTTDYKGSQDILLLASHNGKPPSKREDIKSYDPKPIYDRPRIKPRIFKKYEINADVIAKVNNINAKNIYWGETAVRERKMAAYKPLENLTDTEAIVIGEDFYIAIDKNGGIYEMCLKYDDRAKEEFNEYKQIITSSYEIDKAKTR